MFSLPVKTHAGAENFGAVCSSGPSLLLDKAWSSTSALTPAAGLAPWLPLGSVCTAAPGSLCTPTG